MFTAPPEITVEKSWVHASEGYDIDLVCIIHGDVTSDVSFKVLHSLNHYKGHSFSDDVVPEFFFVGPN